MSSEATIERPAPLAISSFMYRNVGSNVATEHSSFFSQEPTEEKASAPPLPVGVQQQEVDRLVAQGRNEATAETRRQMQAEMATHVAEQTAQLEEALSKFHKEQKKYFSLAEAEVVHLALAIAGRILHREAQVDPLLVAGLVRVAIEKLAGGSTVTVRVSPEQSEFWRAYRANANTGYNVVVVEDADMKPTDCILETELGSADFSIEAQLKEVEQGFCDLLALRPPLL
jgi:flagellar assembly protein FliH